jgi:NAD(P)-dependent dehydrogenase (short-subunit alcohol dehydrogenase family)
MAQNADRVMLITGSNSGIGLATAAQAVKQGFTVYGCARRRETFPAIAAVGAHPLCIDMTDEGSMIEAVREIEARHGAIDVLVNNAGYGQMGAMEDITPAMWQQQFATNVFGLVRLAQLVIPAMRAAQCDHSPG